MQLNLLEKTELKIQGIRLAKANLTGLAAEVAAVLDLPPASVLVIDVREDHICLDILEKTLDIRQISGKEQVLLLRLAGLPGVTLEAGAFVDSSGIMGLIACDEEQAAGIIDQTAALLNEIEQNILRRAVVFATGFEVSQGMIEDTNSPFLQQLLAGLGYAVEFGGILEDDLSHLRHNIQEKADQGFGLVLTTGGVGAEDKDFSVEATTAFDPEAATPWIARFEQGTGRHVKGGIRIGVGQTGLTTVINLPGPHDEVVACGAVLSRLLNRERPDKLLLARELSQVLREKLRAKAVHAHPQHHHRHKE